MTKAELLKTWYSEIVDTGLCINRAESDIALKALCNIINAELLGGGEILLPHLGKLKIRQVAARKWRNPRTGEAVDIPAKQRVVFVAAKELKEALQ